MWVQKENVVDKDKLKVVMLGKICILFFLSFSVTPIYFLHMAVDTVLPSVLEFYDNVYALTDYEDKQDADAVWSKMRSDLPGITVYLSQMEILVPSKCLYLRTAPSRSQF